MAGTLQETTGRYRSLERTETNERNKGMKKLGVIKEEEIMNAIKKLKRRKATGIDGIPNEAWREGIEQLKEELKISLNKVWTEGLFPEEWKTGKIKPIYKKVRKKEVSNYREITLMGMGYKIYAEILRNRLDEQLERQGKLDDTQFGFRKGRGTMNSVYTLKKAIRGDTAKEKGAFDKVKGEESWKRMEEMEIEEGLRERIKEIYEDTRCEIEIGKKIIGTFRTKKEVRQGCPLSPILFHIVFSDVEKEMRKAQEGGVRIGRKKIFSLSNADDVILLANNDTGMREMLKRFRKYIEKKGLELNIEKSKVMEFRKKGGRRKVTTFKWRDERIEEVKEANVLVL